MNTAIRFYDETLQTATAHIRLNNDEATRATFLDVMDDRARNDVVLVRPDGSFIFWDERDHKIVVSIVKD